MKNVNIHFGVGIANVNGLQMKMKSLMLVKLVIIVKNL